MEKVSNVFRVLFMLFLFGICYFLFFMPQIMN